MNRTHTASLHSLSRCCRWRRTLTRHGCCPRTPSSTVDQWVTVDAAVSNDLFYFNHVPLRIEDLDDHGARWIRGEA